MNIVAIVKYTSDINNNTGYTHTIHRLFYNNYNDLYLQLRYHNLNLLFNMATIGLYIRRSSELSKKDYHEKIHKNSCRIELGTFLQYKYGIYFSEFSYDFHDCYIFSYGRGNRIMINERFFGITTDRSVYHKGWKSYKNREIKEGEKSTTIYKHYKPTDYFLLLFMMGRDGIASTTKNNVLFDYKCLQYIKDY